MDLKAHYEQLYSDSKKKILSDNYSIDTAIDSDSDNRFGITLLIRPDRNARRNIQQFLGELKTIDPDQYYYPDSDIHITVMSIISCYDGFRLDQISVADYVSVIEKSLVGIQDSAINFHGITASESAIMISGFPENSTLDTFRANLRARFKNSGLEQSLDKRYSISTAHSTVMRFRKTIKNKEKLVEILEKYRNFDFGKFGVKNYELVYNDWYQRESRVKLLHRFSVK